MPRIPPDNNDVIVHFLNDGGLNHTNIGSGAPQGNFVDYGNPISSVPGLLGPAYYLPGQAISPNHDGTGGGPDLLPSPAVSVSGWIFIKRYQNSTGEIFHKQYFENGWSNPFTSIGIQLSSSSDGRWVVYVTTAGVLRSLSISYNYIIPQSRWSHIGATWDGTDLKAYLNGTLVGTLTPGGGNIEYGSIPRGLWFIGSVPGSGTVNGPSMLVQDMRVANVARPQSYFANIYYNGFVP